MSDEMISPILKSHTQRGVTIVELLVSIAIGLLVVLSATGLVASTKTLFQAQPKEKNSGYCAVC
jgi:prepilin-type N-terminal cleavage/methylation domain-containing protein